MNTTATTQPAINGVPHAMNLALVVTDQAVLAYLSKFDDEETKCEKALEALKVGVIAIQSASPTLDTSVVQAHFAKMEASMREYVTAFQDSIKGDLKKYFESENGVVPRTFDDIIGDSGSLSRTFHAFVDPGGITPPYPDSDHVTHAGSRGRPPWATLA
ncbi:MAG: hypothetical protein KatS3mg105_4937 [Gemmatales bacterium]|nr:MAG: hypothetical protein KatS3mg105_4937 [Gemmatales bacterium]